MSGLPIASDAPEGHGLFCPLEKNSSDDSKEIVHPQVLLRIPCYDLSPVRALAMDPGIAPGASSENSSHALTGGEYKTREHIHRDMADSRLLANPTSRGRVADPDPDWDRL